MRWKAPSWTLKDECHSAMPWAVSTTSPFVEVNSQRVQIELMELGKACSGTINTGTPTHTFWEKRTNQIPPIEVQRIARRAEQTAA